MGVVFLLLLPLFLSVTPAFAEPGFSEKYQRDYNIYLQPSPSIRAGQPAEPRTGLRARKSLRCH
ncbi:MAG: hypothetical protein EWM72_01071 [Nitrospira sp.]|nr:MAG: hypothetical protein EWM72_01071 [Nitrospira sp.]